MLTMIQSGQMWLSVIVVVVFPTSMVSFQANPNLNIRALTAVKTSADADADYWLQTDDNDGCPANIAQEEHIRCNRPGQANYI